MLVSSTPEPIDNHDGSYSSSVLWCIYDQYGNAVLAEDTVYPAGYSPWDIIDMLKDMNEVFDESSVLTTMYTERNVFMVGNNLIRRAIEEVVPSIMHVNGNMQVCEHHRNNLSHHFYTDARHCLDGSWFVNQGRQEQSKQCIMCRLPRLMNHQEFTSMLEAESINSPGHVEGGENLELWERYICNFGMSDTYTLTYPSESGTRVYITTYVTVSYDDAEELKFESLFHARLYYMVMSPKDWSSNPLKAHNTFMEKCSDISYTTDPEGVIKVYEESVKAGSKKIKQFISELDNM